MGQVTGNLEVRAEVLRKMICSLLESLEDETRPLLTPVVSCKLPLLITSPVLAQIHADVGGCDILLGEKLSWWQGTRRFIGILELIKYSQKSSESRSLGISFFFPGIRGP